MPESETREEKSQFKGSPREWLGLIKTVHYMANSGGGVIERCSKIRRSQWRCDHHD